MSEQRFEEVYDKNLDGYKLIFCFYVHRMGQMMPHNRAIYGKDGTVMVCKSRKLAEQILAAMPENERAAVQCRLFLWSARTGKGCFIEERFVGDPTGMKDLVLDIPLFNEADFSKYWAGDANVLRWPD